MTADALSEPAAESTRSWRIEPAPPTVLGQVVAFWRYRRVYWMFAIRGLFHVYRNAILGILWMAVRPLTVAIPAIFVVGNIFRVSVEPLPLPLFILTGLAIWLLFRVGVQWMTKSLNSSRALLRVFYVPALLLMVAMVSPAVFQMLIVLGLVAGTAIYYGPVMHIYDIPLGWHMLAAFPAMLMILALAVGVACFTSILNTFAHDTWLTLRYSLSAVMIATPIVYPVEVIPEKYRWLAYLNPLTAPVDLFRWAVVGYGQVPWYYIGVSMIEAFALLICGIWFFARQQNRLFDHM
jgi:lipopolysaccharide transport system permease protein